MTKEVMIAIRGLQSTPEDKSDQVEVIVPGEYYYRNNKHYLIFEEILEGLGVETRSTVKIAQDCVELTRKGALSTHMVFEKGKKNVTYYNTPYGSIQMGIHAYKVAIRESKEQICVEIGYHLDMNLERVSDSTINIEVRPRDHAGVKL